MKKNTKKKGHTFRKLKVWRKSVKLATSIYLLTQNYQKSEKYGIVSLMRRSAVLISSNISEGAGRYSPKKFSRFLRIAYDSVCELDTQLLISKSLNFISKETYSNLFERLNERQKMIYVFEKRLRY